MPKFELQTEIHAPIQICFDLSRSIDFHQITTSKTKEKAISGTTTGLVNLNDSVTWEAVHFGIKQQLTSWISALEAPNMFVDQQVKGAFKRLHHLHTFEQIGDKVLMRDLFEFESPLGIFGKIFNSLVLTRYMKNFLLDRNRLIKEYAESEKWKTILSYP